MRRADGATGWDSLTPITSRMGVSEVWTIEADKSIEEGSGDVMAPGEVETDASASVALVVEFCWRRRVIAGGSESP